MRFRLIIGALLGITLLFAAGTQSPSTRNLHPDLQNTLLILEETWKILDQYSEEIWPGWTGYSHELYFTGIPGKQDIWINCEESPGYGYRLLTDTLHGHSLYLRDPSPLYHYGNRGYQMVIGGIKISAIQFRAFTKSHIDLSYQYLHEIAGIHFPARKLMRIASSPEYRMGLIAHEAFHQWQKQCNRDKFLPISPPPHPPSGDSSGNLLKLEGQILNSAFLSTSPIMLKYRVHQFLAVRRERWKNARTSQIGWERREEFNEGTAEYIQAQVALRIAMDGHKIKLLPARPIKFYGPSLNKDLKRLYAELILNSPHLQSSPLQRQWRCYYFGMAQAFLLDRLCGRKWKRNVLRNYAYLDQLLEKYSGFSPEKGVGLIRKARAEFHFPWD